MQPPSASELLWREQDEYKAYPKGVVRVPYQMGGLAFFPGGMGLWRDEDHGGPRDTPVGGIMVLGHDFHSEDGYRKSCDRGGERRTQPTWRNLIELFGKATVPFERCFFTNLCMGLRPGLATTGVFPGAHVAEFVAHCVAFLLRQIAVQRPSLLIALGMRVPSVLGRLSVELADWADVRTIRQLNGAGALRDGVRLGDSAPMRVAALAHPSLRYASVRHRRFRGETGTRRKSGCSAMR